MWIAFEEFTTGNFSILGVPNQPWDQGFSIAGVMTSTSATVACILDTELTSTMRREDCFADTKFCFTLESSRTWYHLFCSRHDYERGEVRPKSNEITGTTTDTGESTEDPADDGGISNDGNTLDKGDTSGDKSTADNPSTSGNGGGTNNKDTSEGGNKGERETVCVYKVKATMMVDDDIITYPAEGSNEYFTLKASIEELFSVGVIVLGAKPNPEIRPRAASFNGYIRELRIWSKAIDTGFASYSKRERLDPMAHGALVGYWPLFGGTLDNFVDLAAHDTSTTRIGMSVAKYSGGASRWIQTPNLPSFPYCYKGYVYQPKTSTCVLRKTHTALYISKISSGTTGACTCTVNKSNKRLLGDDITLSIWVYLREKITRGSILFGINGIASIAWGTPTTENTLVGNIMESTTIISKSIGAGEKPATGRWIHYAFATSEKVKRAFLFYDGELHCENAINNPVPTITDAKFTGFTIGLGIVGFIREAKIWNTSLVTKVTGNPDTYDYSAIMLEKFQ